MLISMMMRSPMREKIGLGGFKFLRMMWRGEAYSRETGGCGGVHNFKFWEGWLSSFEFERRWIWGVWWNAGLWLIIGVKSPMKSLHDSTFHIMKFGFRGASKFNIFTSQGVVNVWPPIWIDLNLWRKKRLHWNGLRWIRWSTSWEIKSQGVI